MYTCPLPVDVTIKRIPLATVELLKLEAIPLIVTVEPPTVLPVVLVPLLLTTIPPASAILIATQATGCVLGNCVSFVIASNPPISSILSVT